MLSCLCKECNQNSTRIKAGAGEALVAVEMIGFAKNTEIGMDCQHG